MVELSNYWADHPPVHELVAAFMGVKAKPKQPEIPASTDDPSGIGGLVAMFPSGFVPADR